MTLNMAVDDPFENNIEVDDPFKESLIDNLKDKPMPQSEWSRIGKAALSGLGKSAIDNINTLSQLGAASLRTGTPLVPLPYGRTYTQRPELKVDFHKKLGLGELSAPEKLLETGVEYAPEIYAGGKGLYGLGKAIPKMIGSSEKISKQILDFLGKGKSIEESGKSAAKDINSLLKESKTKLGAPYKTMEKIVGDINIYDNRPGKLQSLMNKNKNIEPELELIEPLEISEKNEGISGKFKDIENFNYNYAKELRTEIGRKIDALRIKKAKDIVLPNEQQKSLNTLESTYGVLTDDMENFLERLNPAFKNIFRNANLAYGEGIEPFFESNTIKKLATGAKENPKNLSTVFKNPEPGISKLADMLGNEFKNKIVYSKLGSIKNLTPQKLLSGFKNLDKEGLSSYITEELDSMMDKLDKSISKSGVVSKLSPVPPVVKTLYRHFIGR